MTCRISVSQKILMILRERRGSCVTARELACLVYADREDGGPDWAISCIGVNIHGLRKVLVNETITHVTGQGYRLDVIDQTYGKRNITKMYKQYNEFRAIVRSEGTPAIQEAFDKIEEWIDYSFSKTSNDK